MSAGSACIGTTDLRLVVLSYAIPQSTCLVTRPDLEGHYRISSRDLNTQQACCLCLPLPYPPAASSTQRTWSGALAALTMSSAPGAGA